MRRRITSAQREADRQRAAHGESLLGADGRVIAGAVFRAASPPNELGADASRGQESQATVEPSEPATDSGANDDDEILQPGASDYPPSAGSAPSPRVTFTLQRDLVKRLDKYLADRVTFMSRSKLQALIESGGVTVNGRGAKPSTVLRAGDVVVVDVPPPPSEDFPPEDIPLDVLFEDEHLIVLNKSADIIVHPARTHTHGTLINALAFHFRNRSGVGGALSTVGKQFARPGVVHRLDRATSGCIVFAKSEQAHWQLANQFMARTVDKRYVAVTHGHVEPLIDVIDLPLGPHPSRERGYREKHVVRHDALGKPAVTVYRVLAHFGLDWAGGERASETSSGSVSPTASTIPARVPPHRRALIAPVAAPVPAATSGKPEALSLVEVELRTGRTHQIRVHFSHRGFPLAGDDMYGGRPVSITNHGGNALDGTMMTRQALHAAVLAFKHPISKEHMRFVAPLPPDLKQLIAGALDDVSATGPSGAATHTRLIESPPGSVLTIDQLLGRSSP